MCGFTEVEDQRDPSSERSRDGATFEFPVHIHGITGVPGAQSRSDDYVVIASEQLNSTGKDTELTPVPRCSLD